MFQEKISSSFKVLQKLERRTFFMEFKPYKNNEYLENIHYQNFLLTSQNNRRMLEEKVKNNSREILKYE